MNQITPESVREELRAVWGDQACQLNPGDWPAMFKRLTEPAKPKGGSKVQLREAINALVEEYSSGRLDPESVPERLKELLVREERRGNYGARFETAVAALTEAYHDGPPADGANVIFLYFPMLNHAHRVTLDQRLSTLARQAA